MSKYLITKGTPASPSDRYRAEVIQHFFLRKVVTHRRSFQEKTFMLQDEDFKELQMTLWAAASNKGFVGWVSEWLEVPENAY